MRTIPDPVRQRAALAPDKPAFIEGATGRVWRFADIDRRAGRGAAILRAAGLAPGDRVVVLCHNTPVFFDLLFAAMRAEIILVPLNWRQTEAELAPILADCGARLMLADQANGALAAALASGAGLAWMPLEAFDRRCEESGDALAAAPWPTERPWYLLYTSGTTGRPKAVIQNAGMMLANAVNVQLATGVNEATEALNFLPLFHTAGINLHTLPVFLAGGTSHVIPKFEVDTVLDLIDSGRLTVFFGVPQVYQQMSLAARFERTDFSRVRHWGCGGAPIPVALIRAFLARGVTICNGMGMTETGPTVFFMDPAHAAAKPGSVGKPQLLAEVRLVDGEGRDVGAGEPGEVLFRGPGITPGYFNNPDATAAAFTPDGWLRSGDVAIRDADGYYAIVDRIKDMYISGGENVYPAEIEHALLDHPAILEAAVIGVPDPRWGEVGHAAILLRPGASVDVAALKIELRQRLAAYKVPQHITILPEFPRTAAGKIQKHLLRRALTEASS
ncbi:acyl-CoA synthetase [Rhabdaerophilum calidifontis]|uniref:acyl-CoA synthetase n=1 Tax=Rhabdaerophilum calidifontis TaxID=2604328 RepID=UPI001238C4CC|nr:long-chain fatty acid--CoA ligase [Rhabdaerophilum calidifontis]